MSTFLGGVILFSSCDDDDTPEQDLPKACFEMSVETGKVGNEITFTNCSENAAAYAWDFGDGTTSTQQEPTHTYTEAGSYTIKLISGSDTNTDGKLTVEDNVDTATETITIDPVVKSIELTIMDGTSWTEQSPTLTAAEGATADLYLSQSSFDAGKPDFTATTDENGEVTFNDLDNGTYFLLITKGDLSNLKDNFLIAGVFQNQQEIDAAAVHPGSPKPGDLKLADLNQDAIISNDDKVDYQILVYDGKLISEEIVIGK